MYRAEYRKIIQFVPVWIYLGICLLFNIILTFNSGDVIYFNGMSSIAAEAGQKLDEQFISRLSSLQNNSYRQDALDIAENISPLYENYDVDTNLASYYADLVSSSQSAVMILEQKYYEVQTLVDHLARTQADMDLYAGPITPKSHGNLFGTLLRAISAEMCLLSMMVTVYLFGYEKTAKTDLYFTSTKVGRRLAICKFFTSLTASVGVYSAMTFLSLCIYFLHWNYSGIWEANVASQFNTVHDLVLTKPFITVADFTVKNYLAATIGLSIVLVVTAVLFASLIGILTSNHYAAGLLTLLIPAVGLFATSLFGDLKMWTAYLYSLLQPVCIWMAQPVWFTEGGFNAPCIWFEVKGLSGSVVIFIIMLLFAFRYMRRRDVV